MAAEVLALIAAACFASSHVAAKFATRAGPILPGVCVSTATGTFVVGVATLLNGWPDGVTSGPLVLFALSGLAGPGVGRALAMRGVREAGASVAVPVQNSTNPLVASTGGLLLFDEPLRAARIGAIGLIISGVWLVGRGGSANRPHDGTVAAPDGDRRVLLWPLAAGVGFASSDLLRKAALQGLAEPLLGAFVGLMASMIIWVTVLAVSGEVRSMTASPTATAWFGLHGLLSAAAVVAVLHALREGDISVVSPIVASQPVIVVLLAAVMLRRLEGLRPGTVSGAVVVFIGVALLSLA